MTCAAIATKMTFSVAPAALPKQNYGHTRPKPSQLNQTPQTLIQNDIVMYGVHLKRFNAYKNLMC